jgi:hypothetical protein
MSRARIFTQGDVTKALKGAVNAGLSVRRIEIDREGKIVVVAGQPEEIPTEANANEWNSVK